MATIAILADVHADDYPGIPGRFDEILDTVRWVGREAVARGADALVCAGDYTESKQAARSPRVVKIAQAFAEGPAVQVHVRGNHDSSWRGESIVTDLARTPGWTGVSDAPGIAMVDDVAVCAIPHLTPAWLRTQPGMQLLPDAGIYRVLSETYIAIARGLFVEAMGSGAAAAILVGHQQLAGGRMTESQQVFLGDLDTVVDPRLLAAIGYSAVVFGHVHRAQTVVDDPACPVLFAGSIERVDWAEELEQKSFLLLDVVPGRPVVIERIPTPARRYVTLTGEQIADDVSEDQVDGAVVRVVDLDPDYDAAHVGRMLLNLGAHAVTSIRPRQVEVVEAAGGMDESLSAEQLVEQYFADDPDRGALVERGRRLLESVS